MTERMHAISQRAYGAPDLLEVVERDRPTPGAGQALIRVAAAGVNPADWKIRSGAIRRFGEPPFTLGLEFSGVVEELDGQPTRFRRGDAVYGFAFPPRGAYAEYVVTAQSSLAIKPAGIEHIHAAALPVTAVTAWQSLVRVAAVDAGQRVLVHAAAGGIGHLAVQIAKARGAYVIGTARRAKHDFLLEMGADEVIDYSVTDFAAVIRDIDVALDPISGDYALRTLDTLAAGGLLVDVRGTGPDRSAVREQAKARSLRFVEFGFTPSGVDLDCVTDLVQRGSLRVVVNHVFPLHDAAKAHELSEAGRAQGKIVLTP